MPTISTSVTAESDPIRLPLGITARLARDPSEPSFSRSPQRLVIRSTAADEHVSETELLSFAYAVVRACGGENSTAAFSRLAAIREAVCEYGSRRPGAPAFQLADRLIRILNDEPATSPVTRETYRR